MLTVGARSPSAKRGRRHGEVAAHPVGDRKGLAEIADREQRSEFLAADAAEQHVGSERRGRRLGKGLQHPVADRVTHAVVDRLEPIEVEQQYRQRLAVERLLPEQPARRR